jgi:ribonucleoside-diphosphate reductase alpha chain
MRQTFNLDQDLALKRYTSNAFEAKPRYNWGEALGSQNQISFSFCDEGSSVCMEDIADMIGHALTDLLLARKEEAVFTQKNQQWVAVLSRSVMQKLQNHMSKSDSKLTQKDLHGIIEKALVEQNASDVARTLVHQRSSQEKKPADGSITSNVRLIRRNGQVVPWVQDKIEVAVRKAFLSCDVDSFPAVEVARVVSEKIEALGHAFVHIEDVQDKVQEALMALGHYKVAERYILYRAERTALRRASEVIIPSEAESQQALITIVSEDGQSFLWDGSELRRRIEFGMIGLDLCLSRETIESELRRSFTSEMTVRDLKTTTILNARTLIEKDADFAKFSARILLTYIYEEVLGWNIATDGIESLKAFHTKGFRRYLERAVELDRLNPAVLDYDLDKLAQSLDPSADLDFDFLGIQTLYDRYLLVDKSGPSHRRLETPQFFWMRVAMGLFIADKKEREQSAVRLYNLYKSRRFCSSTPTLFNSATKHSQLSSCFLYYVGDSIESIMIRGIAENAFLSKWAGGLGGSWTAVRGTGSYIKGTNGESQGVIPFLKLHNDQLVAVNQGGKRLGTGCAYLETWHNDILDFLELRRNTGDERRRAHDMNTANWIPDLFMKRMESRQNWTLFKSNEAPDLHELYGKAFEARYVEYEAKAERGEIFGQKIPAIDLWKKMLGLLFETGHPWITFKDPCNVRNPQDHVGVIHSSNLCTEITLNTGPDETAVCNLGSILLESHLTPAGEIDHAKLRETIQIAIQALDNVIDINFYPTEAARNANQRHRPIGLGIMGLQNALYRKNIPFASQAAVEFNDEFMEAIAYYAIEASSDLASKNGKYSTYAGSKWDRGLFPQDTVDLLEQERGIPIDVPRGGRMDWKPLREKVRKHGMRNSNVMAIAPTATISNIMGSMPCIEPAYKNLFVKSNLSGDFVMLNPSLVRDLKELNLWNQEMLDNLKYFDGDLKHIDVIPEEIKAKYQTAFDISFEYLIAAAARRQKWIDQAQSVNLFLPQADLKTLSHMYRAAWRQGLKTTYYLRTMGASNIEKATVSVKKETRGIMGQLAEASPAVTPIYTPEQKITCSLDAMINGGTCEACQ